jgi:two-component system, OmpR family, sensor histidine kinase TctE
MFWISKHPLSIKKQLLVWLIAPLFLLSLVSAGISYWLALQLSNEIYDELLVNTADSVVARIDYINGKRVIDFPETAEAMFRHFDKDKFYYKIYNQEDKFVSGDEFLPCLPALPGEVHFADIKVMGESVRMISMFSPRPGSSERPLIVAVAETCNARVNMAHKILFTIIALQTMIILGGAIALWIGVSKGLAPLHKIRTALAVRSPTDLSPVKIDRAPPEVTPMIDAINALLSELKIYFASQARFVSDAAHQLRTPLAGLKTFVDLGAQQIEDERSRKIFEQLNIGVMRMTQMVNRLLTLAAAEAAPELGKSEGRVDLNALAEDVVHSVWASWRLKSKTRVNCKTEPGVALVNGSEGSLRDLIENLVHNAILYTPDGGEVTVSVRKNTSVELIVEDNGPGIPPAEREKVFDRFYRLDTATNRTGSGLGLAIVKEIADKHSASIALEDGATGRGSKFTVRFKASEPKVSELAESKAS